MRRRGAIALCLVVAALAGARSASPAHQPDETTFHPDSLPLSFALPSYWEKLKPTTGYQFLARADDLTASLAVAQMPFAVTGADELPSAAGWIFTNLYR